MEQSPIFIKTYDLLHWLIPRTLEFPNMNNNIGFRCANRSSDRARMPHRRTGGAASARPQGSRRPVPGCGRAAGPTK
jgi:hypothetical protein